MLDKMTYISSANKRIEFGVGNILINTNDVRDYKWKYSQNFKQIFSFQKETVTKTIPVLIYGDDVAEVANNLFNIIEYDLLTKQYGKLYIGDYYMNGYFIASAKNSYTVRGVLKFDLTFVSDNPFWIREKLYRYRPNVPRPSDEYSDNLIRRDGGVYIINSGLVSENMEIVFYSGWGGSWVNPQITIGGHLYKVNVTLSPISENIILNTADKTIVAKNKVTGATENLFKYRDKTSYIFQKVPSGLQELTNLPNDFAIDIKIIEERSEPKWQ